jgi:hypothetical protein
MRFLKGVGRFWYDFIIGDDWKIAVAVLAVLGIGVALLLGGVPHAALAIICAVLFFAAFATALMIDVRS